MGSDHALRHVHSSRRVDDKPYLAFVRLIPPVLVAAFSATPIRGMLPAWGGKTRERLWGDWVRSARIHADHARKQADFTSNHFAPFNMCNFFAPREKMNAVRPQIAAHAEPPEYRSRGCIRRHNAGGVIQMNTKLRNKTSVERPSFHAQVFHLSN